MDYRADAAIATSNVDAAAATSLVAAEVDASARLHAAEPIGIAGPRYSTPLSSADPTEVLNDPDPGQFTIRAPLSHRKAETASSIHLHYTRPNIQWMAGTWFVTHTSLPLWKDKRNTRITYTALPDNKIDDLVRYQMQESTKVKRIEGIDSPNAAAERDGGGAWRWRGKGWLKVASSDWEILGWGETPEGEQWAVTYFAKTLFTPPGIDVYARTGNGLAESTFAEINKALGRLGKEYADIAELVQALYAVQQDDAMDDTA